MTSLLRTLLAAPLVLGIVSLAPEAIAQAPSTLSASEDFRISGAGNAFVGVRVGPSGLIALLDSDRATGKAILVYSAAGTRVATIDASVLGGGTLERLTPEKQWGWVGDSIWLFLGNPRGPDGGTLVVVDPTPQPRVVGRQSVARETPGPPGTTPQPPFAMTPTPTVGAMYRDGSILIYQPFPGIQLRIALGRQDLDELTDYTLYVRSAPDGRFVAAAMPYPEDWYDDCVRQVSATSRPYTFHLPFCSASANALAMSADGTFLVRARTSRRSADQAFVRVDKVTHAGDTVFSREYAVPAVAVTPAAADSARRAQLQRLAPDSRARGDSIMRREMPTAHQAVRRVLAGNDGSVFVEIFGPARGQFLAISPGGEPLGMVTVSPGLTVFEVTSSAIWTLNRGASQVDLVRFRIAR